MSHQETQGRGASGALTLREAIAAAERADRAWSDKLNQLFARNAGHVSYTPEGRGVPGSRLRTLYDNKVEADRLMHAAFEADRASKRREESR